MDGFDQEQDDPNSTASRIRGIEFEPEEDHGLLEHHVRIQSSIVTIESTPNVPVVPASSSAINEANRITDASSSRNRDGSETMADKEDDRNCGGDAYDPRSNRGKRKLSGEEDNSRFKKKFTNLVLGSSSNHPDSQMARLPYLNPTTNPQHDSMSIRPEAGHNQRGPEAAASVNRQTQSHGFNSTSSSTQQDRRIPQASAVERITWLNETYNPTAFENPRINEMRNQQDRRIPQAPADERRPWLNNPSAFENPRINPISSSTQQDRRIPQASADARRPRSNQTYDPFAFGNPMINEMRNQHVTSHRERAQGPTHVTSYRARAQGPTFSAGQNQFNQPGMLHRTSLYRPDPMIYNHQHSLIPAMNQHNVTSHRAQGPTSFAGQNQFNYPPGIPVNRQNQIRYPQQNLSGHMPAIPQGGRTVDGNRFHQPPSMHHQASSYRLDQMVTNPPGIPSQHNQPQQDLSGHMPAIPQGGTTVDGNHFYQGRGGRGRGTDRNLNQPKYQYGRGRGL